MFDGIPSNDRMLRSSFDLEQMVSFQMSLFSGILCSKRWKFIGSFAVVSKREVVSWRKLACVASTCSKLLERASLAGFRAGKQERLAPHGSPSVAKWKNSSCCTSNIILWLPGMGVAISVLRL